MKTCWRPSRELKKAYKEAGGKVLLSAAELVDAPPKPAETTDKPEDKKAEEKPADAAPPPDDKAKQKLMIFIALVLVGLGAVGFAFFRWIKS